MFIPSSILILIAVCLIMYGYSNFSRQLDEEKREAKRNIADIDALTAQVERELGVVKKKASPGQRQEIKALEEQGWKIWSWDDDQPPTFYLEDADGKHAMLGPDGRLIQTDA